MHFGGIFDKPHTMGFKCLSRLMVARLMIKAGAKMYAIIKTGGKQYRVQNGDVIFVEKLNAAEDETVTFENVIALGDGKKMKVGAPFVKGATVEGKVVKNGKSKKITVFTYKPKKGCARKMGHRQPYTKVEITSIGEAKKEAAAE